MSSFIETQGLGVRYSDGFIALHDINLRVERGERVAVIGRSGAGKSTLLRTFNRILKPSSGSILLNGSDISNAQGKELREVRREVGMVFQQFNLVSRLSVLDNVLVGILATKRGLKGIPSLFRSFNKEDRDWALSCLEEVQISDLAHKLAADLSGGQQQRVAIARLLAQKAEVILADEPIASLDPRSAQQVMSALQMINENLGVTVITNLHQVDIAFEFSKRVIGLRDGKLIWDLHPDQVSDGHLSRLYDNQTLDFEHIDQARSVEEKRNEHDLHAVV